MAVTATEEPKLISQGVETLINRLKEEGVASGQKQADTILKEAEIKANKLLKKAKLEVKHLTSRAHEKIEHEKQAAEEAVRLAIRNMRLELRQQLIDRFRTEVARLVHKELKNEEVMREILLILATQSAQQVRGYKGKMEIELPATVLEFEEIRKNPKLLEKDPLKHLVQGATRKMLREGVSIKINTANDREAGVRLRIIGSDVELDMSENAITDLLMKHLQPRFRALLEGLMT